MTQRRLPRPLNLAAVFLAAALTVELLDELVDGATGAAWPLVRQDLGLSYAQIGLLLGLPGILVNLVEPFLGLLVGLAVTLGLGWRAVFALLAALTVAALAVAWRSSSMLDHGAGVRERLDWRDAVRGVGSGLQRGEVRLALVLLECANLTGDVFRAFVALYFVDAVGATPAAAGLAVAVLTGVGLVGDLLVLPLLERVPGVRYLRVSAWATAVVFPAFLLVPHLGAKFVLLGLLGLLNAGWYAVLQARLYASLPERSGTVMALGSVAGMVSGAVLLGLGVAAQRFGVEGALWLLLAGPLALLVGLPRREAAGRR